MSRMDELAERESRKKLFDQIVHGLRSQGWSRMDAEDEALARLETRRATQGEKQ